MTFSAVTSAARLYFLRHRSCPAAAIGRGSGSSLQIRKHCSAEAFAVSSAPTVVETTDKFYASESAPAPQWNNDHIGLRVIREQVQWVQGCPQLFIGH